MSRTERSSRGSCVYESLIRLLERTRRIGTWSVDVASNTCHWSDRTYQIHEEERSKTIRVEDGIRYYVPEHRPLIEQCVQNAIERGEPWDIELQIETARGRVRWVRAIGEAVVEQDGRVSGLQGIFEDIHLQKSLELARIAESKQRIDYLTRRLTLALEAAGTGVWEWNIPANELYWDPQVFRLYGVEQDDFEGAYEAWERCLHPDDKQRAVEALTKSLAERSKFDASFRIVRPDTGETRIIRGIGDLQLDGDGQPHTLTGVNWDITEYEQAKQELERSNQELLQLAYRTSHDLKAPLTTIKRLAAYVNEDILSGAIDEASASVERIGRQASTLEQLVLGILSTARADLEEARFESVDFDALVGEVVEAHRALFEEKGVDVEWAVDLLRPYYLPRSRVHQVLSNLVSNAARYSEPSRERPVVRIGVEPRGVNLVLTVEDNGCGIPGGSHDEIFKMFRTLHPRDEAGSGLGLYMVKRHVDALGGTIRVDSSSEGTCFEVEFFAKEAGGDG